MTLRHMKIFRTLCENGCSTTRTAEKLHMTQPAVSLAVKELEQYYGVALFDRIGRRLHLTQAGHHFLDYAGRIGGLFDDMEKGLRDWDSLGVLRVGASLTIGSLFLPEYVKQLSVSHPGVQVRALVAPSDVLERKLLSNELDLVLTEGIPHAPELVSESYMEDALAVICPPDGPFRPEQVLSLEEFRHQDFLLREPGSGTREVFDRAAEEAGFTVRPIWEAMSSAALINGVARGLGITVLPERLVRPAVEAGRVIRVRVEGMDFHRHFLLVHHKDKRLTASCRALMQLCREDGKAESV